MANTIGIILIGLMVVGFIVLLLRDGIGPKVRRDARESKKFPELQRDPAAVEKDQQAADLQVGQREAAAMPARFEPDNVAARHFGGRPAPGSR